MYCLSDSAHVGLCKEMATLAHKMYVSMIYACFATGITRTCTSYNAAFIYVMFRSCVCVLQIIMIHTKELGVDKM